MIKSSAALFNGDMAENPDRRHYRNASVLRAGAAAGFKANEQTDIFSFGGVFYALLSGVHPFEQYKGDWRSLQIAIVSYQPKALSEFAPGRPEALGRPGSAP